MNKIIIIMTLLSLCVTGKSQKIAKGDSIIVNFSEKLPNETISDCLRGMSKFMTQPLPPANRISREYRLAREEPNRFINNYYNPGSTYTSLYKSLLGYGFISPDEELLSEHVSQMLIDGMKVYNILLEGNELRPENSAFDLTIGAIILKEKYGNTPQWKEQAMKYLTLAIKNEKDYAPAYITQAQILFEQGNYKNAIDRLKVHKKLTKNYSVNVLLSKCYEAMGDMKRSDKYLKNPLKIASK